MRTRLFIILLLFLLPLANRAQKAFTDVTQLTGINHQFRVYEGMFGGGVCVFDFNKDGFEDLYITGGMNDDALYQNQGDGTFKNVFVGSGLERTRDFVTQGVVSADFNKDGFRDLLVTTITSRNEKKVIPRAINLLFLGKEGGVFEDVTEDFDLDKINTFSTGANVGDFNGDGWPDVYIANYFNQFEGELSEINDATVVGANQIAEGNLLLNVKGNYFKDVYADYGLDMKGFGFGGLFTDFDNDGDQDLLVNHDFGYKRTPNLLLQNNYPEKNFKNVAKELDINLRINAMGSAAGDYNNDGLMDYYMTNIRFNQFVVNQGAGKPFKKMDKELGMDFVSISWGANWADFDHDGDLDLFVSNGDLNPNCVPMANYYFENLGGRFEDHAREKGLNGYEIGRGSAIFDLENDGDMDIIVVSQKPVYDNYPMESMTRVYRNDSVSGHWLKVKLKGTNAEADGFGSKVQLIAGGKIFIKEIDGGGSSHISQNSSIAHFGLGDIQTIDTLKVYWTGGSTQIMTNIKADQLLEIIQPYTEPKANPNLWKVGVLGLLLFAASSYYALRLYRKKKENV
ncbi:CRTAC1 family protein [Jiulongibacter sediminis]|uniref:Alpha integrin n=1 Tax=Jiulongibacter sediminis TaxID=1605367 RepID=A0A0P7CBF8_9BACT|nr:CRTAC1 family protein [Jiulongibacter sediminis]KPM50077.1 alpha integrin [Jiulongibacter sediminis]